jgi:hypothetical protein
LFIFDLETVGREHLQHYVQPATDLEKKTSKHTFLPGGGRSLPDDGGAGDAVDEGEEEEAAALTTRVGFGPQAWMGRLDTFRHRDLSKRTASLLTARHCGPTCQPHGLSPKAQTMREAHQAIHHGLNFFTAIPTPPRPPPLSPRFPAASAVSGFHAAGEPSPSCREVPVAVTCIDGGGRAHAAASVR